MQVGLTGQKMPLSTRTIPFSVLVWPVTQLDDYLDGWSAVQHAIAALRVQPI